MSRSAVESQRFHGWRTGRLVCGLAATIGLLAAVPTATMAQNVPTNNPGITAGCGLDVALVLDESTSISSAGAQAVADTRSAANRFVTALNGTGSHLLLTAFRGTFPYWTVPGLQGGQRPHGLLLRKLDLQPGPVQCFQYLSRPQPRLSPGR
jgi:hypothetical protein